MKRVMVEELKAIALTIVFVYLGVFAFFFIIGFPVVAVIAFNAYLGSHLPLVVVMVFVLAWVILWACAFTYIANKPLKKNS